MRRSVWLIIVFVFLSLLSGNIMAEEEDNIQTDGKRDIEKDLIKEAEGLFVEGRRAYYNAEQDLGEVIRILESSKNKFSMIKDNFNKFYYSGRVHFLMAEIFEAIGKQREAANYFNMAADNAQMAISINNKSSDVYRLLADSYMRLMSYNGSMYVMDKGPEIQNLLKYSLSLDKDNYKALNSLATYCINAPLIGGGNVDRGIQMLGEALDSEDEYDNFISYIWLTQAYIKKSQGDEAKNSIENALEIYPNSYWAAELTGQLAGVE